MFERIAVVGFGLIGGSIALAARDRWPVQSIVAIDRQDVVDRAVHIRAADVGGEDIGIAADADLVVLAAPVRQNIAALRALAGRLQPGALVTDVGSTKCATVDAARDLPSPLRFVGGHPLAGAAAGGMDSARPDLFRGKAWILTPSGDHASDVEHLRTFVSALGAIPQTMDPVAHDRLMAYLSHLPQLTVSALMHVVGERVGGDGLAFAGTGLRDTTRLAASPATTWRDVTATNAEGVTEAIDELIAALQQLKEDLVAGDELQRVFDSAGTWKRVLDGSGSIGPQG